MNGSAFKTAVTIGILLALVGGVTFVTQYVSIRKDQSFDPPPEGQPLERLVFAKTETETLFSEMTPATGFYDFLFTSPSAVPMELGLDFQSCKCAGVDVRTLNNVEKEMVQHLSPVGGMAQTLSAPQQPLSA